MSSTASHPRKRNPATKAKMAERCSACEESLAESKRKGQHEAMLSCLTCGEAYHAFRCLKLKYARLEIIEEKGWYCEGHKKCEKCQTKASTKKNKLLFCDICDVAWHLGCLPEQYDKVPEGVWACPDCLKRNPNVRKEQQRLNKLRKRVQDGEDGEESPASKRRKVHRNEPAKRTKTDLEQATKAFFDLYYANKDGPRSLLLADLSRTLASLDLECLTYIRTTIGGDTYADISRASETAFLPEDRSLFDKFTEVNNDKDKCEQNNAAWYEDLGALVSRMSTPMQDYIKFKVGDVIWSRLILLYLPRSQNRSVNGFEVDGVNVSEWDLVPKEASSPCTQCIENGYKCEYVREKTDTPACRECAFGDRQCDVKPVYQTTTARLTRGSTLVPVGSIQAQSSPKRKRKVNTASGESISQVASGSQTATELPPYTAHGLSTPQRRRSSASPMGARERYRVSPPRAQSVAPPSISPQQRAQMTTPRQNAGWPFPPSPQLSVSPTILPRPMIQPLPQQAPYAGHGLDRPFLFSSQPSQPPLLPRPVFSPPPPTRPKSPPPPPTRPISVPHQPLTPSSSHSSTEDMGSVFSPLPPTHQKSPPPPPISVPHQPLTPSSSSHSSTEDMMDHNSGSVVSSSSYVDPYLEREVVRKDREIARKDAELAELRMRLQRQSPEKEKILEQRLLEREQEVEKKFKLNEELAARLEVEKREFERDRREWVKERDAQKEVVRNLIGQLAHAQSQML